MFIETVSLTELGACQSVYLEHSWDSPVISPRLTVLQCWDLI